MEDTSGKEDDYEDSFRLQQLRLQPDMSTPAVTTSAEITTAADTMPATTTVIAALVESANDRRSPPKMFLGNARHASMPQIDSRPRRLQENTMTAAAKSAKEQTALNQRQQHGRSNSATVSTASERGVHRVFGGGGGASTGGGGGGGGVGAGFKSKLRNSFRSTAKRIRQQQSAIDALAKNSQMLGLHNLQDSPRTMQVQRTTGRVSVM